jgi:hypothetical protein
MSYSPGNRREHGVVEPALAAERRVGDDRRAEAPTMPPMQWTPNTSSVSSYLKAFFTLLTNR